MATTAMRGLLRLHRDAYHGNARNDEGTTTALVRLHTETILMPTVVLRVNDQIQPSRSKGKQPGLNTTTYGRPWMATNACTVAVRTCRIALGWHYGGTTDWSHRDSATIVLNCSWSFPDHQGTSTVHDGWRRSIPRLTRTHHDALRYVES
jgi:hypothetical protein